MRTAALFLMFACGARLPALPSQGGPPWIELRSPHFQLWTDVDESRGRALMQQMEHFRSIIFGVAFPELPPGGVTFVVALRDHRESEVFTPPAHPAIAFPPGATPILQPMIIMPGDAYGDQRIVAHELTHAISYNAVHDQPRWFAEGIATYFETIDLDTKRNIVDVGETPLALGLFKTRGLGSVNGMFTCKSLSCTDDPMFYAAAWTMFAYLRNTYPKQLAALEQKFEDIPSTDAWQQVFPDHPMKDFGYELAHWLQSGDLKIWSYTIELREWPVVRRNLTDADVHAVRALMFASRRATAAGAEVSAALDLDPTNLMARAVEVGLHHDKPSELIARAVVKAHPTQWQAWALLSAASTGNEQELAEKTMCNLVLKNPSLGLHRQCVKKTQLSDAPPPSSSQP